MKEGECDSWRDCMANRFSTVQITVKYCCIFVLLFRWYLLQLDNKKQYRINGIQYNTIQYNTIRYNTIQYNTIQYSTGLQIISWLVLVKLCGQTYFCLDISHFWPNKHRLCLIAIKVPPPPFPWCLNMKQVNFQSIYCTWASISMQEKWNLWYIKISITFVWKFATIAGIFMTITNHLLKVLGLIVKYPPFFPPFSQMPIILNL